MREPHMLPDLETANGWAALLVALIAIGGGAAGAFYSKPLSRWRARRLALRKLLDALHEQGIVESLVRELTTKPTTAERLQALQERVTALANAVAVAEENRERMDRFEQKFDALCVALIGRVPVVPDARPLANVYEQP